MKTAMIHLNGSYLSCPLTVLDVFTPGVFKARGVFETMLAVGDKVFDVQAHLKRLKGAMPRSGITPGVIQRVVKVNGFAMARVRVVVWEEGGTIHQLVMALEHKPARTEVYKACFMKTDRKADSRRAKIKSLDYALFADAYAKARARGFDEAILLNEKGHVFEASRANVFVMHQGVLMTPPLSSGCLEGITRAEVIRKALRLGIKVRETVLTPQVLMDASDVFLTNSLIGIKPVKISSIVLPR